MKPEPEKNESSIPDKYDYPRGASWEDKVAFQSMTPEERQAERDHADEVAENNTREHHEKGSSRSGYGEPK